MGNLMTPVGRCRVRCINCSTRQVFKPLFSLPRGKKWLAKPTSLWFWGFWGSSAPHLVGKYIIPGSFPQYHRLTKKNAQKVCCWFVLFVDLLHISYCDSPPNFFGDLPQPMFLEKKIYYIHRNRGEENCEFGKPFPFTAEKKKTRWIEKRSRSGTWKMQGLPCESENPWRVAIFEDAKTPLLYRFKPHPLEGPIDS